MHVYFVRHGETALSKRHIHQPPNTPLSAKGEDQIASVAETLREINPDILISSEYTRAFESARIIGLHVGLTPITNGLFYEIMRPSNLFEKSVFNIETLWYVFRSVIHRKDSDWHYTDAENFTEITTRAHKALEYLESLQSSHQSVVVVSHTIFINIMVSYMCKNRLLDVRDLILTLLHVERIQNGEIIHLEYVGKSKETTCSWLRHQIE